MNDPESTLGQFPSQSVCYLPPLVEPRARLTWSPSAGLRFNASYAWSSLASRDICLSANDPTIEAAKLTKEEVYASANLATFLTFDDKHFKSSSL